MAAAPAPEPPAVLFETRPESARGRWAHLRWIATAAAFCILGACCVALWIENHAAQKSLYPWRYSPALADL